MVDISDVFTLRSYIAPAHWLALHVQILNPYSLIRSNHQKCAVENGYLSRW